MGQGRAGWGVGLGAGGDRARGSGVSGLAARDGGGGSGGPVAPKRRAAGRMAGGRGAGVVLVRYEDSGQVGRRQTTAKPARRGGVWVLQGGGAWKWSKEPRPRELVVVLGLSHSHSHRLRFAVRGPSAHWWAGARRGARQRGSGFQRFLNPQPCPPQPSLPPSPRPEALCRASRSPRPGRTQTQPLCCAASGLPRPCAAGAADTSPVPPRPIQGHTVRHRCCCRPTAAVWPAPGGCCCRALPGQRGPAQPLLSLGARRALLPACRGARPQRALLASGQSIKKPTAPVRRSNPGHTARQSPTAAGPRPHSPRSPIARPSTRSKTFRASCPCPVSLRLVFSTACAANQHTDTLVH